MMKRYARILIALLLLALVSACQQPVAPEATQMPPPAAPTGAATAAPATPIASVTATPEAPGPSPAPGRPIEPIAPIEAQLPDSFKPVGGGLFASFRQPAAQGAASVQAPAVAPDLSNVELTALLAPEQRARLAQSGFVVSPGQTKEFYELYERVRYDYAPAFVTSDSLLHVYHLLFDKTLRRSETEFFIPMLGRLDWELLHASAQQFEALGGTPWADAARRNAAYFAVAVKTLNPEWAIPDALRGLAEPDLASIAAHDKIGPSAIFPGYPRGEDWSQYVPRGHYTKSDALKRYFVAMMWHGRMTFRADDPTETRQAALLTLALRQARVGDQPAGAVWSGIYEPTVFFVGRSDDLTPQEYGTALDAAYGQIAAPRDLLDEAKFARFQAEVAKLRAPQILGMVISTEQADVEQATKGLRFMGQRFVPDAFVFRQLIARNVPERSLPKALDFFAALGSDRALGHLADSGDTKLTNYQANMDKLRAQFAGYGDDVWTQNLYWSWIHSLRPLLDPPGAGYPQFMRSDAWQDKQLTTALGSWTELKRDTILYAKQVYAEGAGALSPPTPEPPKGYVEPVPLLYARVVALSQMTIDGLQSRGLLKDEDKAALDAMARVAAQLQTIAEKELRGEAPTDDEYRFIRFYGAEIEALTFAADDESAYGGPGGFPAGGEPLQAAVVADVATDTGGQVLEEGVGRIFEIYVVAPVEGRLVLAKGGVFSHYEFGQPLSDRLTDEAWRAKLDAGQAPPLAGWTGSFVVQQKVEQPLADTITQFNDNLVKALWFTAPSGSSMDGPWDLAQYLTGAELDDTLKYIEQLKGQGQFAGMKRLSLQFLSFDFQDEAHATVATRERWADSLYSGSPSMEQGEPVKIGVRPAYETVVTYTMQREGAGWKIAKIVLRPDAPAWQKP